MKYEVLFKCPFCIPDTGGNHAWNCPMNPNKYYTPDVYTIHSNGICDDEILLFKLKQSGKRLKELLSITEEDIDRAIKELRRE